MDTQVAPQIVGPHVAAQTAAPPAPQVVPRVAPIYRGPEPNLYNANQRHQYAKVLQNLPLPNEELCRIQKPALKLQKVHGQGTSNLGGFCIGCKLEANRVMKWGIYACKNRKIDGKICIVWGTWKVDDKPRLKDFVLEMAELLGEQVDSELTRSA